MVISCHVDALAPVFGLFSKPESDVAGSQPLVESKPEPVKKRRPSLPFRVISNSDILDFFSPENAY